MIQNLSVVLVDDHSVVRQGIAITLKKHFQGVVLHQAPDFQHLLYILETEDSISLILLDINMPGGNSIEMIHKIKMLQPLAKILIFSAFEEKHYALRYIQAGANGYLNKLEEEDEIVNAIRQVITTGKYMSPALKENMVDFMFNKQAVNPLSLLSEREFEIANLLVSGDGNLEIANKLNIHMSTVSTYKARVYNKLNVDNVVSLADLFKLYNDD